MPTTKQVIVGKFYNGFKNETYDISDFDFNTLRNLPFYYDESTIYFSLLEEGKTVKTIFIKNILPRVNFYELICAYNPNPLSMEPVRFNLKDLPELLHATSIVDFDIEFNYNREIRTTPNYKEVEKAFLKYISEIAFRLKDKSECRETVNIFNSNPFDFFKYGKQTSEQILGFLRAFEYKNPFLKATISSYREYIIYNELISGLENPSSRRA